MGCSIRKLFYLFLSLCAVASAQAAEITIVSSGNGHQVVSVRGQINLGDDERFTRVVLKLDEAIVLFDSPGGNLSAGLGIGRVIQLKKFLTAVDADSTCASACALAWLSGSKRFVAQPGHVGFHAAYFTNGNGQVTETGSGNALVGAYLNGLGMTTAAIQYLTERPPAEVNWLSPELAKLLGIETEFIQRQSDGSLPWGNALTRTSDAPIETQRPMQSPTQAPTELKVITEDRFVVIEDRDIFGNDFEPGRKAIHAFECQSRCAENDTCKAYTYNASKKVCFLKSGGSRVWWSPGTVSAYKPSIEKSITFYSLTLRANFNLIGEEYQFSLDSNTEKCAELCADQNECSGFTYARKEQGKCSLKRGELKLKSHRAILAGVKTAKNSRPE